MFDLGLAHRPELALPSISEALSAFRDLSPADYAVLMGGAVWLFILSMKLIGIDRRDVAAGFGYMLFASTAGVALLLAVPRKLATRSDVFDWLAIIGVLSLVASIRWFPRRSTRLRVDRSDIAAPAAKKKG